MMFNRVLNVPLVLNMAEFRVYQGCEYDRVTQGSEYARIYLNNFWRSLIVPKYVWICVNIPKCAWMVFVLLFLGLLERVVTNFSVYTKLWWSWRKL